MIFYNLSLNIEDEKIDINDFSILCLDMEYRLDNEKFLPQSPIIFAPSFNSSKLLHFPYRYSQWRSSSIYPRLLTSCEHHLLMNLLIIIDRICREHYITYFINEGTLIGSLRHHDIIPWDDDIDILIPYHQRKLFSRAFKQFDQTLLEFILIRGERKEDSCYKIFYKNSPNAGENPWGFPFIDIFLYIQNETHLWWLKDSDYEIPIKYVFPLILRPLGQLWVPAPNEPQQFLRSNPFDECLSHYWNHRYEIEIEQYTIECKELNDVYPFVERINSTEVLKINNTIIHTIVF
jgi:hypothetical protein